MTAVRQGTSLRDLTVTAAAKEDRVHSRQEGEMIEEATRCEKTVAAKNVAKALNTLAAKPLVTTETNACPCRHPPPIVIGERT